MLDISHMVERYHHVLKSRFSIGSQAQARLLRWGRRTGSSRGSQGHRNTHGWRLSQYVQRQNDFSSDIFLEQSSLGKSPICCVRNFYNLGIAC